jgi:hypothetical protein
MKFRLMRLVTFVGAVALLATLMPAQPSRAVPSGGTDWVVTRTDDPAPGGCVPGDCSLREAVMASNANPGVDTIRLSHGATYDLTIAISGTNSATTGDLTLTDCVNFDFSNSCLIGLNCGATIRGGPAWNDRIFVIQSNAMVQMNLLTIEHGSGVDFGGGIFLSNGPTVDPDPQHGDVEHGRIGRRPGPIMLP